MSERDEIGAAAGGVQAAIEGIVAAYDQAAQRVRRLAELDADTALQCGVVLGGILADLGEDTTELRSEIVANIWQAERLTLAQLAQRTGVSKSRAHQLVAMRQRKIRKA